MAVIKRFAFWLILVPISLIFIAFALTNRQPVILSLNPFAVLDSTAGAEMPLFFAVFIFFLFGALVGAFITWNTQRPWRNAVKRQTKEIEALRNEINILKNGAVEKPLKLDWQILPPL